MSQNTGSSRGIEFTVFTQLKYDKTRKRHYLEVMNSIANETARHYYSIVDAEYIRNMPDDVLRGSYNQLKKEIIRRAMDE